MRTRTATITPASPSRVRDDGSTTENTDQSPNSFTFNVAAVNDAPTVTITPGGGMFAKAGGEFLVNTTTPNNQDQPTVTSLASGGFVVSWADLSGQGGDASGNGIKAQIFDAAGAKVGAEFLVNTATLSSQSEPTITSLALGGFVVSWTDESGDASGRGIKAQLFVPAPYTATEQVALSLKGGVAVADVDAGGGTVTATLSVGYGVLDVTAGTSGATILSGNGTSSVVVSGTIAQINALLRTDATSTITFTANTDAPPGSTPFAVTSTTAATPAPAAL